MENDIHFVPTNGSLGKITLGKIVLPADQRLEALKRLEDYNINHFTLFQSEDALIKTVATRVFDIGE